MYKKVVYPGTGTSVIAYNSNNTPHKAPYFLYWTSFDCNILLIYQLVSLDLVHVHNIFC